MTLGYVVLRDGLFHNQILTELNLCSKALNVLLKVMMPQNLTKWFTEAELRKNTSTLASEMIIITSIGVRIGFLKTKFENGKGKFAFDPMILTIPEEQFLDNIKTSNKEAMSLEVVKVIQLLEFKKAQRASFGKGNRKIDKIVADEIMTQEGQEEIQNALQQKRYRKSIIDDPEAVAIYNLQKSMDSGTLNKKTAKDLHEEGICGKDVNVCRFCALEQDKAIGF